MKTISKFSVLFFFLTAFSLAQVTIVENTTNKFQCNWDIVKFDTLTVSDSNQHRTEVSFKGENIVTGEANDPAVPGYSFYLAVPAKGDISVSIVPEEIREIHLSNPLRQNKFNTTRKLRPWLTFPTSWISAPSYSIFKNYRAAHIVIRPFIYNKSDNTIRVLVKASCSVTYPPSTGISGPFPVATDYDKMLKELFLNSTIASGWQIRTLAKKQADNFPLSFENKTYSFRIGDGHIDFNEATTNENGIIKIPGSRLIQLFGNTSLSNIALYASQKGELSDGIPDNIPDGVQEIPLLRYDANGNGKIDNEDYVLAYVTGASDWKFNNNSGEFDFNLDRYDDYRTYWLTEKTGSGLTMNNFKIPVISPVKTVDHYDNHIMFKESNERPEGAEGGLDWVWQKLSTVNNDFNFKLNLPNLDTALEGFINVELHGSSSGSIGLTLSGEKICAECNQTPVQNWGNRTLDVKYADNTGSNSFVEIKDIVVDYQSPLKTDTSAVRLEAFSSNDSGIIEYQLKGTRKQQTFVFRVTPDERNISLIDTLSPGSKSFGWSDTGRAGIKYFIADSRSFIAFPDSVKEVSLVSQSRHQIRKLRSSLNSTDFLIVTPSILVTQAESLAVIKEKRFKAPAVVTTDDIYKYFSGGNVDPSAIRNFITYIKRGNWTAGDQLVYVILFGYGNYDFKNLRGNSNPVLIPIYQADNMLIDDFYTYTVPDSQKVPQLAIGRFPCINTTEAMNIVNKIKEMEDPQLADYGSWRNRALFIADDDKQGDKPDGITHYTSSENVARLCLSNWPSLDMRKVYLFEYPWNISFEKPEASQAILNEINNGVGCVNFFGHGALDVWADEHILTLDKIQSLNNAKQYPVINSFSCSVGKFDSTANVCLSGDLVRQPEGGAIATISSTRLAYATNNEALATSFYNFAFDTNATRSIGIAFMKAKALNQDISQRTYVILGDPSIIMLNPTRKIILSVKNAKDQDTNVIKALQTIKISGTITGVNGNTDQNFGSGSSNAYVQIGLFNAAYTTGRKDGGEDNSVKYTLPGSPVFLARTPVKNGTFSQTLRIPKNISYDQDGVRLIAYAWRDHNDSCAIGHLNGLVFHGTATDEISGNDTVGPRITIRPDYDNKEMKSSSATFSDHIVSLLPLNFEIDLFDQNGIDVSGIGPDEGLILEVEGVMAKQNINNKFQFKVGDFRQGSATVTFNENSIKPGSYQMNISARDLLGNLSKKTFTLEITSNTELKLDHVFNFPNPTRMGSGTRFYFYPSNTAQIYNAMPARVFVKIYTLGGKLLCVKKDAENGWLYDGRDQVGNILTPGIYLYQVTAISDAMQKTVKSGIKKLVIYPPR